MYFATCFILGYKRYGWSVVLGLAFMLVLIIATWIVSLNVLVSAGLTIASIILSLIAPQLMITAGIALAIAIGVITLALAGAGTIFWSMGRSLSERG